AHVAHGDTGQLDGLELRGWRESARLAHVDRDREDARRRLPRGELVGDGPARMMGRRAEAPLLLDVVDLDDHAVGVVAARLAPRTASIFRQYSITAFISALGASPVLTRKPLASSVSRISQ